MFSLNYLYASVGISKQAVYKQIRRQQFLKSQELQVLWLVEKVRVDHPEMGLREMYFKIKPRGIGRDRFEKMCQIIGLGVQKARNYRRTTNSSGVIRFTNLIKNLEVTGINQLWQSDITYYEVNDRFYYITLIQDAFSKVIVGHSTSRGLSTEETTLRALKMAIRKRKSQNLKGLIFHSDGGGQYYDKGFLELTSDMRNSMCKHAWENGMAESLNGVIKNKYLRHRCITSFEDLKNEVDRTVLLYNHDKPHSGLKRKTPIQFEKGLTNQESNTVYIN